ncbi:MAG: primosomal protein N' [Bacteroidales bacterium]|jgi:primosomal protein N' (replication factor Y)|nr:primosomal protein N' [Bacteroidales bacterium]
MQNQIFAEILLPLPLNETFTYIIPEEFYASLKVGYRVLVNFGKRKIYTGIVVDVHGQKPDFEPKPILSVIDNEVFVNTKQIELWRWIAAYYCCSSGEVMNAAIPGNLIPSSEHNFFYISDNTYEGKLSKSELRIIDYLQARNGSGLQEIISSTDIKNPVKIIESLEEKEIISFGQKLKTIYKPRLKNIVYFNTEFIENNVKVYESILKQNSKQKVIIDYLMNLCSTTGNNFIQIEENIVLKENNALKSSLKSLEDKNLLLLKKIPVSRISEVKGTQENIKGPELTEFQKIAYENILKAFRQNEPVLLHGITSSGKTEIYIKLIEQKLKEGKEILYLLPEIALTSQIIERLRKYFGNKVGIYHSKYSYNVRSEVYKSVSEGKVKIVLGARSAVFLPFNNLGLIIVDEEHESSYKQFDPDPRYNARDMAIVLSNIHKANVILGSATPSVESYFNSAMEKYSLVELNMRYGNVNLPHIVTVDLKDAYRRKIMNGHFHPVLLQNIRNTLEKREQVILFQNRRGYSPYIECKDCGWVPHCKNCNVSLTYHKYENKLVCHYCGDKVNVYDKCPVCSGTKLTTKGFGTERIEDEILLIFPEARIARLDYDTASSRKKYEKILHDFEDHNLDILIGTQMVTKGLDFGKVSLVGILNADNMLNFPDFRAFERAFQLMLQVSGRAGRREEQGKVIIQTYDPEHPVIKYVISNDYKSLYDSQIQERELFRYPPFWNFIVLKLKNKDKEKLYKAADILVCELKKDLYERVKGPEEPLINKINNVYILNIHIRFEKKISASKIKEAILDKCKNLKLQKEFSTIAIEVDVDPM